MYVCQDVVVASSSTRGLYVLVQYRYDIPFMLSQSSPEFVVFSLAQPRRGILTSIMTRLSSIRVLMVQVPGETISCRTGIRYIDSKIILVCGGHLPSHLYGGTGHKFCRLHRV